MKKHLLLSLFFAFCMIQAMPQTVIFSDNFESYTPDALLVQQSGAPWLTWNQPYHAPHDVYVRTTQASEGNQSVQVIINQDIVLDLGAKTTGRYQLMFDIYVVSGKAAYFNVLNDFDGANSTWAFQAFFNATGNGTVDANGVDAASFTFSHNTWLNVNIIFDVDDDFATFYLNGSEVVSWEPSKGAMGAGSMHMLDGICFYGHTNNEYFVDDVKYIEVDIANVPAPINLQASLNAGDVELIWNAPVPTPDSYVVVANNTVIATGIADTTFVHLNPYPGNYTYTVKAHYDMQGYSHSSNDTTIVIAGGVARNYVVMEKGTGTWCPYCPGAAMAFDQLHAEGHNVALIAYHSGDSYETTEATSRLSYYGISSFPSTVFDGGNLMAGGHATQSLYPSYRPVFNEKIAVSSLYSITMDVEKTGATTYTATVEVTQHSEYFTGPFKLYAALTESNIAQNWQNQTQLHFVFRKMFPNATGTTVDFSSSTTYNSTINFEIQPTWVKDNCEFIVFLQHPTSKTVLQAALVDMSTVISVDEFDIPEVVVRPNPASEFISVYAQNLSQVQILSLTGQLVMNTDADGNEIHLNIEHLPTGMYLVRVDANNTVTTRKLIVK